ncbi:MAG: alpha/beta hydrolase [Mucilaginibacter sp.]|nr:alpha/beta hydrolase [Mucilaginibacter sp.]
MKHYIITNRSVLSDGNGEEYIKEDGGEEPSEYLRFGEFDSMLFKVTNARASVKLFADLPSPKRVAATQSGGPIPYFKTDVEKPTDQLSGSTRTFAELYNAMIGKEGGDLLFFVHGFHTNLNGALQSVCDLENHYINKDSPIKHIVVFTWPAMNKLLRYRSDARDAELSGFTLARCYQMLIDFFRALFLKDYDSPPLDPCGKNIHLLAHSMGNRVIENMMIELNRQKGDNITALFKEVILAASDVDWQIFEDPRAFYSIVNICQRVTVYYNTRDLALVVSETTKNAYNRLGKFGFRDCHKVPSHVYSVDCSGLKDQSTSETEIVQHWYYKESPKAVIDIIQVLKGKNVEDFIPDLRTAIPGNAIQYRIK